jgi:hypothetical protein
MGDLTLGDFVLVGLAVAFIVGGLVLIVRPDR